MTLNSFFSLALILFLPLNWQQFYCKQVISQTKLRSFLPIGSSYLFCVLLSAINYLCLVISASPLRCLCGLQSSHFPAPCYSEGSAGTVLSALFQRERWTLLLGHFLSSPWRGQQPHRGVFLPGQVCTGHQCHHLRAPLQINGFHSKDKNKTKPEKWLTPVPREIKEEREGDREMTPQPYPPENTEVMWAREWNKMDFSEGGWAGEASVWLF